jgi:hypothetical protein
MARDDFDGEVRAKGVWLYAGTIEKTIEVVAFDCDYFYDRLPADDSRRSWEPYPLNAEGLLYYLKPDGDVLPTTPFESVVEAQAWADRQAWGPVQWQSA